MSESRLDVQAGERKRSSPGSALKTTTHFKVSSNCGRRKRSLAPEARSAAAPFACSIPSRRRPEPWKWDTTNMVEACLPITCSSSGREACQSRDRRGQFPGGARCWRSERYPAAPRRHPGDHRNDGLGARRYSDGWQRAEHLSDQGWRSLRMTDDGNVGVGAMTEFGEGLGIGIAKRPPFRSRIPSAAAFSMLKMGRSNIAGHRVQ